MILSWFGRMISHIRIEIMPNFHFRRQQWIILDNERKLDPAIYMNDEDFKS